MGGFVRAFVGATVGLADEGWFVGLCVGEEDTIEGLSVGKSDGNSVGSIDWEGPDVGAELGTIEIDGGELGIMEMEGP